jgi:hypothetical protein
MGQKYEFITVEREDRLTLVTLNRPAVHNALHVGAHAAEGEALASPKTGFAGLTSRFSLLKPVIAAVNGAAGSVNSVPDLLRHPHLRQTVVGTPSGPATVVEPATRWTERTYVGGSVPALGEHNDALRAEFG